MDTSLDDFNRIYGALHGYSSLIVCLFGTALNFFNIIVLTQKHMKSSTNKILTALAVSDFLAMIVYIPASIKFYILARYSSTTSCSNSNFFWSFYTIFYANLTVIMHSTSIWLTVLLAFFRYVYITHNEFGKILCSMKYTHISIITTCIFCICFSAPIFLLTKIVEEDCIIEDLKNVSTNKTIKVYNIYKSDIEVLTNGLVFRTTFFIQAFCVKLVPCLLLIIFSSLLVYSIHAENRNKEKVLEFGRNNHQSEKIKEYNRTTIMLVLVCFLFFITEFPQGVLAFLSIIFESKNFYENVYVKLGDMMDIITLLNSAVNFILYCLMSHVFRETFKNVLCKILCFKSNNKNMTYKYHKNSSISSMFSFKRRNQQNLSAQEDLQMDCFVEKNCIMTDANADNIVKCDIDIILRET